MRDRTAVALARQARDALDELITILPTARGRLREWSGTIKSSRTDNTGSSSEEHSDPTVAAIQAAEVLTDDNDHAGWRSTDPHGDRLKAIDIELRHLRDNATSLARELGALVRANEDPGEEGCALCDNTRQPVDHTTGKAEHECNEECSKSGHLHPASWQKIHSRKAPAALDELSTPVDDLARCQFHYDFAKRYGVDTDRAITLWHLDHLGSRIPYEMLRQHHPAQFQAHHARRGGRWFTAEDLQLAEPSGHETRPEENP